MAKKRSIVTLGPTNLSLATTGNGGWIPFGPTRADRIYGQAIFSAATAGNVKLQGALTTASTNDWFTVLQRTQAQTTITASTVNKLVARLRLQSTQLSSGTVSMVFGGTTLSRDFVPTDLSGLVAWYDASRITGLSDGAAVAQWDDLSGNGNHLTQGTAAARPIYKVNIINGLPVVRFDGTDDYISSAADALSLTQPYSVFFVVIHRSDMPGPSNGVIFDSLTFGANRALCYIVAADEGLQMYAGNDVDTTFTATISSGMICRLLFNGASSTFSKNGATPVTIDVGTNVFADLRLGASIAPGDFGPDDHAEWFVYNRLVSANETTQIEQYLSRKYAIGLG